MPDGTEYHRGRWEGQIEERVSDLEADLEAANGERKKLQDAVAQLEQTLQIFNAANKEREAVSLAVADALGKLNRRWYDRAVLIIAALSALAATLNVLGIFR